MANQTWVYIDHYDGKLLPVSLEAVGAAAGLGGEVSGVLFGRDIDHLVPGLFELGISEVILADHVSLADFRPEPFSSLLAEQVRQKEPEVIVFPTTTRCRELAAMLAVDCRTGVLPDVISIAVEEGQISAVRPIYAGKLLAKVVCREKPQLITVRGRTFRVPDREPGRQGTLTRISPFITETEIFTQVEGYSQPSETVSLVDAAVVVSGGRGTANNPALVPPPGLDKKAEEIWRAGEAFKLIRQLADVLSGAVGASRAAVDAGYIDYPHQIGQTGKIVSPDLYIACGISGAIQHLAGMRTSKVIVAINKDPNAPIFKYARFGVVGDLFDIVPALTQAFQARLD